MYKQNSANDASCPEPGAQPDLTEREADVLRQLAFGSSIKEIAAALRISAKTVDTYKAALPRAFQILQVCGV